MVRGVSRGSLAKRVISRKSKPGKLAPIFMKQEFGGLI